MYTYSFCANADILQLRSEKGVAARWLPHVLLADTWKKLTELQYRADRQCLDQLGRAIYPAHEHPKAAPVYRPSVVSQDAP